ncbi:MAG TPA: DMT family transporter [Actinomycetota bacterium]|nr:DMT family transporter [Actinomycetota bacterium]
MDRHPSDPATAAATPRRLLETGRGSRPESFGPTEWLLLASVALIWGSSFLFIDVGLEALQPGVIAVARVALGVAALALVPAARRPIGREDRPRVAFLGVIWAGLPLLLFPVAQQWIDSSVAGMLNGAVPLAGAAWAVVLLGRPLPRTHAVGLLVGFAGVLAISWPQLQGSRATTLGAIRVVLAVLCYGLAYFIPVVAIVLGVLLEEPWPPRP